MTITSNIRNLNQARLNLRQIAIKQLLTSMMLQYGVDDLVVGLRQVYRENVFPRARFLGPVKQKAELLDDLVEKFKQIPREVES